MADDFINSAAGSLARNVAIKGADAAFNFIPTWGEIGGALGLETGASSALAGIGGAAAAFAPAGLFLLVALALSSLSKPPQALQTAAGKFSGLPDDVNISGPEMERALSLYDAMIGDRSWYAGGDPSKVGDSVVEVGRIRDGNAPYYGFDGPIYDRPDTAVDSFRQIARGRMDLPVNYEPVYDSEATLTNALNDRTLAPFDAPDHVDFGEWMRALDQRNSRTGGGEGMDATLGPSYEDQLSQRAQEFFRAGWTPNIGFAYTGGPETPIDMNAATSPAQVATNTEVDPMMSPLATALAKRRMNTDSVPAMISPNEATILKGLGGSGERNPDTGMFHFANPTNTDDVWANIITDPDGTQWRTNDGGGNNLTVADVQPNGVRDLSLTDQGQDIAKAIGWSDDDCARRASQWEDSGTSDWGGGSSNSSDPFADEQRFLDNYHGKDKATRTPVTPPPPPKEGNLVTTPGLNSLDFGSGQQQIQNLLNYYKTNGQVPVGDRYNTDTNTTDFIYDPRNGFGGGPQSAWEADPTYGYLANLPKETFDSLAKWLGLDPNGVDTWLAMENYLGTGRVEQGPVYANGSYQGLNKTEYGPALSSGVVRIGSGPNAIDINLDDVIAGRVPNYNAINLALSSGYDPNGKYGTMDTLEAAQQLMQMIPELATMMPNSAEYNATRKPFEIAQPGFNAQVANNRNAQIAAGRQAPDVPIGVTSLDQVIRDSARPGVIGNQYVGANGQPVNADLANARFMDYSNMSTNDAIRIIPGWGGSNLQEYPGGIYLSSWGKLVKQPNGLFLDEYGLYRDPNNGMIVNADGSIMRTQYAPNGHFDIERVFGGDAGRQIRMARDQAAASALGGAPGSSPSSGMVGGSGGGGSGGTGNNTGNGSGSGSGNGSGGGSTASGSALDAILAAFPAGYELSALGDLFDDPIIARILSEQTATAGDTLSRARASGQLSDIGYNTAYGQLTGSATDVARSRLQDISDELLAGGRQDIRDLIAEAIDYASVTPKGFNIQPYKDRASSLVSSLQQNYYGNLMRQLGGSLFDVPSLLAAGGQAQSPLSNNNYLGTGIF